MALAEASYAADRARLLDGLAALAHDLRWNNHGVAAAQVAALAERFQKDTQR
jgi:hypothetical protein